MEQQEKDIVEILKEAGYNVVEGKDEVLRIIGEMKEEKPYARKT